MFEHVFDGCEWLTFPETEANLTRSSFTVSEVSKATLKIIGLGYFEAYINGKEVSSEKFKPPMSDYEKRDLTGVHFPIYDELTHRIYYFEYDITDKLICGENVLAAHIGAGWYGQKKSLNEGMPRWGDNTLVFCIECVLPDGSAIQICSSRENTKWKNSYILESSLYFGEYHDAKLFDENWALPGYADNDWNEPDTREAPETELNPIFFPTDSVIRTIVPEKIFSFGDISIYDIGETASGYAVVRFTENAGTNDTAVVRYADALHDDGSLEFHYCGGTNRMQRDTFIFDDGKAMNEFYPHFTWHAARYIELTGKAEISEYRVIHSDITQIAEFTSDNETLNWIFNAYVKTQLTNIHGCIPSDCPHRERLGYTGDGQLTCGAVMSVFDARRMYRKWIRDILDCQDKKGGHVQHTAPFYGGGGGPGGWGGAVCIVPWRYYEFYADDSVLNESFDGMKKYISYMLRHSENGIVTSEEEKGWCLGDWCPPNNDVRIPEAYVNSYYLAKCAEITSKTAAVLGAAEDSEKYAGIFKETKEAIINTYFDPSTGSFCGGVQGADAFAADIGIATQQTINNIVKKYTALGTFDTGIFGTDLLIRTLFRIGQGSLAFRLLINEEESSFYNMKKHGATTLWENWEGCDSRCHPMFGAIVEYFFSDILGIRRCQNAPGYEKICFEPAYIPELKNVHGKMKTPFGEIEVDITTDENGNRHPQILTSGSIEVVF